MGEQGSEGSQGRAPAWAALPGDTSLLKPSKASKGELRSGSSGSMFLEPA